MALSRPGDGVQDAWVDRPLIPEVLTRAELIRLARWSEAYRAEAMYGAEDGKKWAFARFLKNTHRINEGT
jgi:hypothetical protein